MIQKIIAGGGRFADRRIGKYVVGYYYCCVINQAVIDNPNKKKVFGESLMGVAVEDFEKWSIKMKTYEKQKNTDKNEAWNVPSFVCVTGYMNVGRKLRSDDAQKMVKHRLVW